MASEVPSETVEELEELTAKYGLGKELYDAMLEKKDAWKKEKISIAVVGPSRIGKSSHINALMGEKLANVSATKECTMECTSYPHPKNRNIIFWDVPGMNTLNFNRENYNEKINFDRYDFFLILTQDIFADDTKWLTDEIQNRGKSYYLVRTKVDITVRDALEEDEDGSLQEEDILADIRDTLKKGLHRQGFSEEKFKVYLVNNKNPKQYDFRALEQDICSDSYSKFQQEALMLTIGSHNTKLLEAKYAMFKSRIKWVAMASAAGGAVPIPGVSATVDLCIIIEEVILYYRGFGLDKESVKSLEKLAGVDEGEIEKTFVGILEISYPILHSIRNKSAVVVKDPKLIKDALPILAKNLMKELLPLIGKIAASEAAENIAKFAVPVVGMAVGAAISYGVTCLQLKGMLNDMVEVARDVHTIPTNQQAKRLDRFAN